MSLLWKYKVLCKVISLKIYRDRLSNTTFQYSRVLFNIKRWSEYKKTFLFRCIHHWGTQILQGKCCNVSCSAAVTSQLTKQFVNVSPNRTDSDTIRLILGIYCNRWDAMNLNVSHSVPKGTLLQLWIVIIILHRWWVYTLHLPVCVTWKVQFFF